MNNSGLLIVTLIKVIKSFKNIDLVEIIKSEETNLFLIKEFKEI